MLQYENCSSVAVGTKCSIFCLNINNFHIKIEQIAAYVKHEPKPNLKPNERSQDIISQMWTTQTFEHYFTRTEKFFKIFHSVFSK